MTYITERIDGSNLVSGRISFNNAVFRKSKYSLDWILWVKDITWYHVN